MLRQDIVKTARLLMGTPFHHAGRTMGTSGGVDCAGLVVVVARLLNYPVVDQEDGYSRMPDGETLHRLVSRSFDPVIPALRQSGDIGLFWFDRVSKWPQHVGILTDTGIIHSTMDVKRVVETPLSKAMLKRLCHVFKFRGLED